MIILYRKKRPPKNPIINETHKTENRSKINMKSLQSKTRDGTEIEIIISDNAIKSGFSIGKPTDLEMIVTDKNNEQYQADVFLKSGWTHKELQEIITRTVLSCDVKVKRIQATIKGLVSIN
ncbi:hypothetical protein CLU97_0813 [Chryseobacterium sp. 7]|nr:hypothetical protein CLU97_0813 [Chryseobacterium sp. 7]